MFSHLFVFRHGGTGTQASYSPGAHLTKWAGDKQYGGPNKKGHTDMVETLAAYPHLLPPMGSGRWDADTQRGWPGGLPAGEHEWTCYMHLWAPCLAFSPSRGDQRGLGSHTKVAELLSAGSLSDCIGQNPSLT